MENQKENGQNHQITSNSKQKTGFSTIVRNAWPNLIINCIDPFTMWAVWYYLNIIFISNLIWPNEPFHGQELSLIPGITMIIFACCGLFWGFPGSLSPRTSCSLMSEIRYLSRSWPHFGCASCCAFMISSYHCTI